MERRIAAALIVTLLTATTEAGNWPAWRGPQGTGVADETGVPVRWSATENVKWRTPLPGPGNSTPIVWNDRVFVTQATDEGRDRSLICFDRQAGTERWRKSVRYEAAEHTHETNSQCASSPVTDGDVVVAWHGSAGLFAYDLDGRELWKADLGTFEHIWGYGSSPVIHDDLVILNAGPGLKAFVVGLDKRTGKEVWRRNIAEAVSEKADQFRGSWSTPVLHTEGGRETLLLGLPQRLHAFDPRDGETLWSCGGLGELVYASPVFGQGIIVAMSGYHGPSLAVRAGGEGDVTSTHRRWQNTGNKLNPQRVGSGVVVGDHLYILQDSGIAWCMEVKTGEIAWEKRLGKSWSSVCHVDGRLYVIDMQGTTWVFEANPTECVVLAENEIEETTRASLGFSDGNVFVRTYENLYCIEE